MNKAIKLVDVGIEIKNKPHLHNFAFEENGMLYWWGSWYATILGYKSLSTLKSTIEKAKDNCYQIGLSIEDNFLKKKHDIDGKFKQDYRLTKFACFLIAMQADNRKVTVKKAQAYFLNEFRELNILSENNDFLERKGAREEIKNLNTNLNKSAARSRVRDYSYFNNEGFIGMYNTTSQGLKELRDIDPRKDLYDHMSVVELAANIFRITMTTERLKHINNRNEQKAAREHWKIGAQIRAMIKENTGFYPEYLPTQQNLNKLESKLKQASKYLNTIENHNAKLKGV